MNPCKGKRGFTLIELLVVIAIIGVLSTLAIVALGSARQKSRDSKRVADLNQIGKALELYYGDNNSYPTLITPGQPIAAGSVTYMAQVPSNPAPRNDGSCPNQDYAYSASTSGNAYTLGTCLSGTTGAVAAGGVFVSSAGGSGVQGCGQSLMTDQDGNSYPTVQLGTQCWMAQNLRVGTKTATTASNNGIIEKACYGGLDSWCVSEGALYEWNEAMQYVTTPGAQGICPTGWHIPTHDEWSVMERAVCTSGSCVTDFPYDETAVNYRGTNEGTKLKPGGSANFMSAAATFSGRIASGGGGGSFSYHGTEMYVWSSTQRTATPTQAWYRDLVSSNAAVYRESMPKASSAALRCVQN